MSEEVELWNLGSSFFQQGSITIEFQDSHLQKIPLIIDKGELDWTELAANSINQKIPEFIISPFGECGNCPKNIRNLFRKQVFNGTGEGKGWIVHDGISTIAQIFSKAIKDEGARDSTPFVIANVDSTAACQATEIVEKYRDLDFNHNIIYDSTKTESNKKPLVRFCSQFILSDPDAEQRLPQEELRIQPTHSLRSP